MPTNADVVRRFVEVLLQSPELTMEAVRVQMKCSDYELKLLKADPLKSWHSVQCQFPMSTGQKGREA